MKLTAKDNKQYMTDCLDNQGIIASAKTFPGTNANRFIEWFTYAPETIKGKSKTKAYALFGTGLLNNLEPGTIKSLQKIHSYLIRWTDYSYYYEEQ